MSVAREPSSDSDVTAAIPLVGAGSTDRCAACGAQLAHDQRYCVECGNRRGAPRFQLAGSASGLAADTFTPAELSLRQRISRPGSSAVLLIGLFILLLALGVGVLIGHNGNTKSPKSPVSVVVNDSGGGAGSSAGSAASTTAATTGAGASGASRSGSSSKAKSGTKKTAAKATSKAAAAKNPNASATGKTGTKAAAKSFGNSAASKSTVGGACTAGTPGCVNGKQTGNLFP
jgi:hypothetical protein